jgi:hypothetical protein
VGGVKLQRASASDLVKERMTMTQKKLIPIFVAATMAALATTAAADHPDRSRWSKLGEVDTHPHDDEDFIPVARGERYDRILIRAHGGGVPIEDIKIQFTDGRTYHPSASGFLRPGQQMIIDIPGRNPPIKMLIIDYANRRPYFRYRATAWF